MPLPLDCSLPQASPKPSQSLWSMFSKSNFSYSTHFSYSRSKTQDAKSCSEWPSSCLIQTSTCPSCIPGLDRTQGTQHSTPAFNLLQTLKSPLCGYRSQCPTHTTARPSFVCPIQISLQAQFSVCSEGPWEARSGGRDTLCTNWVGGHPGRGVFW